MLAPPMSIAREVRAHCTAIAAYSRDARMYLLASMFMAVSIAIQNVLYNLYLYELGLDERVIGQVAGAVAAGIALGGIPAGLLYDRFGGRFAFRLSTAAIALCMVLRVITTHPNMLVFWAAANGLAFSVYYVSIFPFITSSSQPRERPYLYASNLAVWTALMVVGSLVSGHIVELLASVLPNAAAIVHHRFALLSGAMIAVLAILPLSRMGNQNTRSDGARRGLLPSARSGCAIARGAVVLVLMGLVVGLTSPFYNIYFKRVFGASEVLIGSLFSLSQLVALLSAFVLPYVIRRWGLVRSPSIILALTAPFLIAVGLEVPLAFVAAAFLVTAGMERLAEAPIMNLVMEAVEPTDRGAMSGIRLVCTYSSQAIAGAVGGWIVVDLGYSSLFVLAAGVVLLAACGLWFLFHESPAWLVSTQ